MLVLHMRVLTSSKFIEKFYLLFLLYENAASSSVYTSSDSGRVEEKLLSLVFTESYNSPAGSVNGIGQSLAGQTITVIVVPVIMAVLIVSAIISVPFYRKHWHSRG
jgi:hypothetical protein